MDALENDFICFWVANGILYSKFKFELKMDLEKAKQLIETRHAISNNTKQYWCYDVTLVKDFPKECREYADKYGQDYLHACALIINSHVAKFLFNTYIKLQSQKIPFQVFTKKEKAVEWLLELKAKNERL